MHPLLLEHFSKNLDKAKAKGDVKPFGNDVSAGLALTMGSVLPAYSFIRSGMMNKPMSPKTLIPASIVLAGMGYALPKLINRAMEQKVPSDYMRGKAEEMNDIVAIHKTAGLAGTAARVVAGGVKDFVRGIGMPVFKKGMPFKERALSVGSKAVVGYGAYKAGQVVYNRSKKPDYVDYLRNQMYAGNIRPQEIDPNDVPSIQKLSSFGAVMGKALPPAFAIMSGMSGVTRMKQRSFTRPYLEQPSLMP